MSVLNAGHFIDFRIRGSGGRVGPIGATSARETSWVSSSLKTCWKVTRRRHVRQAATITWRNLTAPWICSASYGAIWERRHST